MATINQTTALIQRIALKSGVQRTLILSRKDGAVVESFGYDHESDTTADAEDAMNDTAKTKMRISHDAGLVFAHVESTANLVSNMSDAPDDDLKLLRLRTKRHEFMIVPDANYIAVVIRAASAT